MLKLVSIIQKPYRWVIIISNTLVHLISVNLLFKDFEMETPTTYIVPYIGTSFFKRKLLFFSTACIWCHQVTLLSSPATKCLVSLLPDTSVVILNPSIIICVNLLWPYFPRSLHSTVMKQWLLLYFLMNLTLNLDHLISHALGYPETAMSYSA